MNLQRLLSDNYLSIWGAVVIIGWMCSQLISLQPIFDRPGLAIINLWTVLISLAAISSYSLTREIPHNNLIVFWPLIIVVSLVINYAAVLNYLSFSTVNVYGTLWFLIPALGFIITAHYFKGRLKILYLVSALLNMVTAIVFYIDPGSLISYYYSFAAVLQGAPMLIHNRLNRVSL